MRVSKAVANEETPRGLQRGKMQGMRDGMVKSKKAN